MSTALQLGNEAFRRADYAAALAAYVRSLGEMPEMAAFTLANVDLTRRRLLAQRADDAPWHVVITCSDMPRHALRVAALAQMYQPRCRVTVLGSGSNSVKGEWATRQLDAVVRGSGAMVLSALCGEPPDLIHLVGADEGCQLLAIAGRALWGCAVAVDLSDGAVPDSPFWAAAEGFSAARAATDGALAVCALPAQVSTWLPRLAAWRGEPARRLPSPWITLIKQQPAGPGALALRALAGLAGSPAAKPAALPSAPMQAPNAAGAGAARVAPPPSAPLPVPSQPAALSPVAPLPEPRPRLPAVTAALQPRPELPKGTAGTVNLFGWALAKQPAAGSADAANLDALLTLVRWRAADPGAAGHPAAAQAFGTAMRLRLNGTGRCVADIGHLDDQTLRWRLDGERPDEAAPVCHVSFFQIDATGTNLIALGRARCEGPGPHFLDVRLAHPLHPVLLVASDGQDQWLDASLLPFPSLTRGGMHHAELWMCATGPVSMAEVQATSNSLLHELLGQPLHAGALSLSALEIDIAGATGAERLLQAPWRQWLAEVLGLTEAAPVSQAAERPEALHSHLLAACAPTPRNELSPAAVRLAQARTGGLSLRLPADALPSLSVLTSRRLSLPAHAAGAVGAHAMAHMATGRPQTLVSLPPLSARLLAWQPASSPLAWPVLARQGTTLGDLAASEQLIRCEVPLAVRLGERQPLLPSRAMQPVPTDRHTQLWPDAATAQHPVSGDIHALLVLDAWLPDALTRWAESLRNQTVADAIHLVVSLPDTVAEAHRSVAAAMLQSLWPERHRLIISRHASRTRRLNEAADGVKGFLLLVEPETLLHDPRTAGALRQLASQPDVASASCVLVREVPAKKGTDIAYVSGGLFPSQLSFAGRVSLVIEEVVTRHAFPLATYPVLANSFRLAMIAAETWHTVGGLDADRHPMHHADVDFSIRAGARGLQHLCTSMITATSTSAPVTTTYADTQSIRLLPLDRWQAVLDQATLLQELGA